MGGRSEIIASTTSGKIEGTYLNGLYIFKGVPYAAPPVGNLRWVPVSYSKCPKLRPIESGGKSPSLRVTQGRQIFVQGSSHLLPVHWNADAPFGQDFWQLL